MTTRRQFLATTTLAASAMSSSQFLNAAESPARKPSGASVGLLLPSDDLKPATVDRLTLSWNKASVRALQERLTERGIDGVLLTDRWNVISDSHQAPWLSLGDHSMLEPGMCFSVEPGLFDSENGFGTNFSDTFAIEPEGPARQMSRLPWSEEWCLVKL